MAPKRFDAPCRHPSAEHLPLRPRWRIFLAQQREAYVNITTLRTPAIMCAAALLAAALTAATAQTPRGPDSKPLVTVDLASEIDSVAGRIVRMQMTTYQPGASNTAHSHKDRPEVVYVLSGKIIDHQGNVAKEYGPGDSFTAGKDTTHWMENTGTVPAVLIVSTIAKKE
jgi:quercetin dioxygenase-like cupin family protein